MIPAAMAPQLTDLVFLPVVEEVELMTIVVELLLLEVLDVFPCTNWE